MRLISGIKAWAYDLENQSFIIEFPARKALIALRKFCLTGF